MPLVALLASHILLGDVKQEIEANYAKIADLLQKKNVRGAATFLTRDFTEHERSGLSVPRNIYVNSLQSQSQFTKIVKWDSKVTGVVVSGDTVTATVHSKRLILLTSAAGALGHTMDIDLMFKDSWVKMGQDWRLRSSQVVDETVLQDGKPTHRPRH